MASAYNSPIRNARMTTIITEAGSDQEGLAWLIQRR